ncbi:MAG: ATP-binding protein, partial [Planctomycetes bacterium]|nr:ATP-binding protein [Planctomycetota bacterium]
MCLGALQGTGLLEGPVDAHPEVDVLHQALVESIPARVAPQQASSVDAWLPRIAELRRRGAGPTAIFDRPRLENAEFPESLSAVKCACPRLRKEEGPRETDVPLRVETRPGEVAVDDLGLRPLVADEPVDLSEAIRQRYARGSMIVTSNRAIAEWPPLFLDALVASAAMDRLLHDAQVIVMDGDSYR